MKSICLLALLTSLLTSTSTSAWAQGLSAASRTVYKCEQAGKVSYSDEPCAGAKKLDVEPTRGLNQYSGREQIGPDVARERRREMFADAARPLTGMDAKQLDRAGRRMKLSPEAQQACQGLDLQLPDAERVEREASTSLGSPELRRAQDRLLLLRKQFRRWGCE